MRHNQTLTRCVLAAGVTVSLGSGEIALAQTTMPGTSATTEPSFSLFRDSEDGAFDISNFLSTKTGFLPIVQPITEPAIGYGLGGGLAFFHTRPQVYETPRGPRVLPPDVTFVGGLATENGTWAGFAGHLHTWNEGRVRYLVGGAYGSFDLDWFGQGDAFGGRAFSYNMEAWGFLQKLTFKVGDSDFFAGGVQQFFSTSSTFDSNTDLPPVGNGLGILSRELDSNVSGLGLTLGYDTRNSMFSPSKGTKASLTYVQNAEAIGSDFNYGRLDGEICHYVPLGGPFTLGMRANTQFASDEAPFFNLASVNLRGIQMGRYVDNVAATLEAELRWDITTRWTIVTFGGVGWTADNFGALVDADDRWAGGAGFRYLVARKYDLRLGCDAARGPEDWAFYVSIGTGWLRD